MLRWIFKVMGQGLMAIIPIGLTLAVIIFMGVWVERLLANPFKGLFPEDSEFYRMGMGIVAFLLLTFVVGLLMRLWLVQKLVAWIEGRFMRLPLVKTVFSAIKDVTKFVGGGKDAKKGDMVVMVTLENGWRQLGIVTRQDFSDLPDGIVAKDGGMIAVFLPFSYQLGGFTYFIDRSRCEPIAMSVEDAMRYSVMAWLGSASTPPAAAGENGQT